MFMLPKTNTVRRTPPKILWLVLLLLAYFGVGLLWALRVPTWESYDEPGHFGYAAHYLLPANDPMNVDPVLNSELIQPPIYYLILAAFLRVSNSDVTGLQAPRLNPYFYYGTSGRNYALHPDPLTPDQARIERALYATRIASLLITLFGVVFTYRAARELWPDRFDLALTAAAIFALWPQHLFNSSVVSNDSWVCVLGALLTWMLLRFARLRRQRDSFAWAMLCLVMIGVGVGVKLNISPMLLPLVAALLLMTAPRVIAIVLLVGGSATIALIATLQRIPGLLLPFMGTSGTTTPPLRDLLRHLADPSSPEFMLHALRYAIDSSLGLFGWGNLPLPEWIQTASWFGVALAIPGILFILLKPHEPSLPVVDRVRRQTVILFASLAGIVGAAMALSLLYGSIYLIPGRYLLPGLPAFCVLLPLGWSGLGSLVRVGLRGRAVPGMWLLPFGAVLALMAIGLLVPATVISLAYVNPPFVAESTIPNYDPQAIAPGIEMLGYEILTPSVYPEDSARVDVYWKASQPIYQDYTVQLEIVGPDGQGYGILDTFPGNGNYPTTNWQVNHPFKDRYDVPVRKDFPAPNMARFKISLVLNKPVTDLHLFGTVAVHVRQPIEPALPASSAVQFGDRLLLRDSQMQIDAPRTLSVGLLWQVGGILSDHTVFIHVVDASGKTVAQQDNPPRNGGYPFSLWQAGEIVPDSYSLVIPDLPPGAYSIQIGVYNSNAVLSIAGKGNSAALTLGVIHVEPGGALTLGVQYGR